MNVCRELWGGSGWKIECILGALRKQAGRLMDNRNLEFEKNGGSRLISVLLNKDN